MNTIKVNYVDRVYVQLRKMITEHQVKPNEQLLIANLSIRLNVSTTPIREALNRLLNEKLVVKGRNRGFFICDMNEQEQRELIVLREALLLWVMRLYLSKPDGILQNLIHKKKQDFLQTNEAHQKTNIILLDKELFNLIFDAVPNTELRHIYHNCMARCGYVWHTFIGHGQHVEFYREHYQTLLAALWRQDLRQCEHIIQEGSKKLLDSQHIPLLCFNADEAEVP